MYQLTFKYFVLIYVTSFSFLYFNDLVNIYKKGIGLNPEKFQNKLDLVGLIIYCWWIQV